MGAPRHTILTGRSPGSTALPLIITPLVGRTAADIEAELGVIVPRRPDLLEWRIDHFDAIADRAHVREVARTIRHAAGDAAVLLTRRSVTEGGRPVPLSEGAVVDLLAEACATGDVDLIDYELSNPVAEMTRLRAASAAHGVALVASFHDFQRTPAVDVLLDRFADAERRGADVAKVAVMPQGPEDVLSLLAATHRASLSNGLPLISISMGSVGALSRVVGWMYGSAATFAVGKSGSAPGQIEIDELRQLLAGMHRAVTGR